MKNIIVFIVALLIASPVLAQSTAQQTQPGYLTTSGCSGLSPCFIPYSSVNPMPVTASAGSITGVLPVANGGTSVSTSSSYSILANNTAGSGVWASVPFTVTCGLTATWGTGLSLTATPQINVDTTVGTYSLSSSDCGTKIVYSACGNASVLLPSAASLPTGFAVYLENGKKTCNTTFTIDAVTNTQTLNGATQNIPMVFTNGGILYTDNTNWYYTGTSSQYAAAAGPVMPTPTGCGTITGLTGNTAPDGTVRGVFNAGQTSCVAAFASLPTAPNGWICSAKDITTTADLLPQTAKSATSCTVSGTVVSGDTITMYMVPY